MESKPTQFMASEFYNMNKQVQVLKKRSFDGIKTNTVHGFSFTT